MMSFEIFSLTMMPLSYFPSFYYCKIKSFPGIYLLQIFDIIANNNCFSFINAKFKKTIVMHLYDGSPDSGGGKLPPRLC